MDTIIALIKGMIAREPARVVAYGSTIAIAGAIALGNALGVELSDEMQAAVGVLAAGIVTELLRRFVFSPATTQAIADRAAATGDTNIGNPPAGEG